MTRCVGNLTPRAPRLRREGTIRPVAPFDFDQALDFIGAFPPMHGEQVVSAKSLKRADRAGQTAESKAMAKELKKRGFRFMGPTTAYSTMQAAGIVNDHAAGCCVHGAVEAAQSEAAARFA